MSIYEGALERALVGARIGPEGWLSRLPAWASVQVPTTFMRTMVETPAGARLRYTTNATELSVHLEAHPIELPGVGAPYASAIDLVLDGQVLQSMPIHGSSALLDFENDAVHFDGGPERITFASLPPGKKSLELWLPHTAFVRLLRVVADAPLEPVVDVRPARRWIHHGSSISHCLEAKSPTKTWPNAAALALGFSIHNLAFAGNALLDPFVARTIRDSPADLITLKLGINLVNGDQMRSRVFQTALDGFLDTIRDGHPITRLVVISPIACPVVETQPGPTEMNPSTRQVETSGLDEDDKLTLDRIRVILKKTVQRRARDDAAIDYLDGRVLFDDRDIAEGLLPDGLHPSEAGYARMASRFAQYVRRTAA